MTNPIEADSRGNGAWRSWDTPESKLEGAGPFSGAANAIGNFSRGDITGGLIETAGASLDALGAAMHPFKALSTAGIGWLIEHVGFLNDFLSALAGDPGMVADQAQTWTNIGDQVTATVEELRQSVARMAAAQQGDAVMAYHNAVEQFAAVVANSAQHAYSAASATHTAGTLVATTQALLRDWIAEWSVDRVTKWIAASALTPVTFGGAQAAFVTDSVISGARLAGRASSELRTLARQLDELAAGAESSGHALKQAARALDEAASGQGLSRLTKHIADAPGMTKASRFADEGALASRMDELGASAKKHVMDLGEAKEAVDDTAKLRADAGKDISDRKAPGTQPQKKAAHSQAKNQHRAAQARRGKADEALNNIARQAGELAADANTLRNAVAIDKIRANAVTATAGHPLTKAQKELVVQSNNEAQRAENAEQAYRDQQARSESAQEKTSSGGQESPSDHGSPGPQTVSSEHAPPSGPDSSADATPSEHEPAQQEPRSAQRETWQVWGTLDG